MLSSSWLQGSLPTVLLLAGLVSTAVWLNWPLHSLSTNKHSSVGSGALSRHSSSSVYSDLPFHSPLPVVLLSFAAHWLIFYLLPLPAALSAPAACGNVSGVVQRNYVVSTVHAACAVSAVSLWLSVHSVDLRSVQRGLGGGRRGTGDEWHWLAVSWSLGYFLYDVSCMLLYRATWSVGALLHHCSIGSAFLLGLLTGVGRPFHFLFLLEELSTLPLNLKSLMSQRNPALAERCAAAFAVSFFVARLGYGSAVLGYACMQILPFLHRATEDGESGQAAAAVFQFVMCLASRLLNLYWAALIARKLRRALGGAAGGRKQRLQHESRLGGSAVTSTAGGGDKLD